MIGKLILIAALVAGIIVARQWWRKPSVTPNQRWQAVVMLLLVAILVLAASGKLNPLLAAIAALLPIVWKLLATLSRHLPAALKAWQLFNRDSPKPAGSPASGLDRVEALQVLGLGESASRDDIINAHRRLIQKVHPDRGGSDYLATRINLAKDVLLKDYA